MELQTTQDSQELIQPTTREEAVMLWQRTPKPLYNSLRPCSYEDVFKSVHPQLSGLKKELGEGKAKAILTLILIDLVNFFSVGKSMDTDQINQTADLIMQNYWILKPDDFKLFANNFKMGQYGKMYDRIDGAVIIEALEVYVSGRYRQAASMTQEQHEKYRMNEKTTTHNIMVRAKENERIARSEEINARGEAAATKPQPRATGETEE